jgi:phosphoenolpyruvate carboxykinase (GTP)
VFDRVAWDRRTVRLFSHLLRRRRSTAIPLISKSFNWSSGVYLGATMGSDTTAAAAGATGKVNLDSIANAVL